MRLSARLLVSFCAVTFTASLGAQRSSNTVQTDSSHVARVAFPSYVTQDTARTAIAGPATSAASTPIGGASLTGLRAGMHMRETARASAPNAQATHANLGQDRALMIVGGAGLIAGAIIGGTAGTLIMVGGALIGLYGLYDYLQ